MSILHYDKYMYLYSIIFFHASSKQTSRAEFALQLSQQDVTSMFQGDCVDNNSLEMSAGRIIIFTQAEKPTIFAQGKLS